MPIRRYNREQAVAYAHEWAYSRNPKYYNFDNLGGDCTNFASQVLYAGSGIMNYTPTFGWYYINLNNRAPAWTGVPYLYNFLTSNQGVGPFGHNAGVEEMEPGDLVQLLFKEITYSHTPVIVKTGSPPTIDNILVAAHSYDADNKPLTEYDWIGIRFVHIDGVRYS